MSHEFVTADREVQHTTFGDGTQVWVNFGAEPWTLRHQGKQYALPQYGFYAAGPKLQQYRVLEGGRRVTCVRAPGYLFADADVPGVLEFALDGAAAAATERTGGQTCRVEGPGRLRVNFAPGTKWVKLNPAALCPGSGRGAWRVADLAADGTVRNLARPAPVEGGLLRLEPGGAQAVLLVGPEALADHAEVVLESLRLQPTQPRQGQATVLTARLTNLGGRDARALALGLAPVGTTLTVKIPAGQTVEARFNIDTRPYDGTLRLTVTAANQAREICTADNNGALGLAIDRLDVVGGEDGVALLAHVGGMAHQNAEGVDPVELGEQLARRGALQGGEPGRPRPRRHIRWRLETRPRDDGELRRADRSSV